MRVGGTRALSPLEAIGLHDLHERLAGSRPGKNGVALFGHPTPFGLDFACRRRAGASRHKPMQAFLQDERGHGDTVLRKPEMEILEPVEVAAAPLSFDARGTFADPGLLGRSEVAAGDPRHPNGMTAFHPGGRAVAAVHALGQRLHHRYSAMKRLALL